MSSFCKCKSYSHVFSKNINVYAIFNDQCFNGMLTNEFRATGSWCWHACDSDTMNTIIMWAASRVKVLSNTRKVYRFKSSCAYAKYHPGICSQFIHSIVSNDSVSGQGRPWSACADAQADLGLRWPHMPEKNVFAWCEALGVLCFVIMAYACITKTRLFKYIEILQ